MSNLMADTRLLRVERYILGEPEDLMQLAEEITRNAFYICWQDGASLRVCGTGFLLASLSGALEDMASCVVTAAHVIEGIKKRKKRDAWLLMNSDEGVRIRIRVPLKNWWFHPTDRSVDVAVADWNSLDCHGVDHSVVLSEMAVTPRDHKEQGIREGGDVFCVGVFTKHSGRSRVIPIVRTGNIALMPNIEEPVYSKRGPMEAYLIECRSLSLLSGSPVFSAIDKIVPPIIPTPPGFIPAEQYKAEIRSLWAWIGLMHGHWDIDESDLTLLSEAARKKDKKEPLNTGIAVVVPAWKVMEVVNHPKLVEMRKKRYGDQRIKNAPKEDGGDVLVQSQETHAQNPKHRIRIPIPTRGEVLDVFKKASRKREKK